jgi:hypothetical protein
LFYSPSRGVLFIAVPKTGTSSITKALAPLLDAQRNVLPTESGNVQVKEHISIREVASIIGWSELDRLTVVAGIRNPWDRLVSTYHFFKNGRAARRVVAGEARSLFTILAVLAAKALPFRVWLRIYRSRGCHAYLADDEGKLRDLHVLRLENLQQDLDSLCEDLGVKPIRVPVENPSDHAPYGSYFDARSRQLVARRYAADIDQFGYAFPADCVPER